MSEASRKDHISYEIEGSSSNSYSNNKGKQTYNEIYNNPIASSSSSSKSEITDHQHHDGYASSDMFEITEGLPLSTIKEDIESSLFSYDIFNGQHNVYVAVGKGETSLDALSWTLKNAVFNPSSTVFLVHVCPEIRLIPSPLGMLPKSHVGPELVEQYIAQQRAKRRELLNMYLNICAAAKVKVDTLLIECDSVPKAILELIPILSIRKLVVGMSKAGLKKMRSRRGNGTVDQIVLNAPQSCDVTVVCEGIQVLFEQMIDFPSVSSRSARSSIDHQDYSFPNLFKDDHGDGDQSFTSCISCFKPKVYD